MLDFGSLREVVLKFGSLREAVRNFGSLRKGVLIYARFSEWCAKMRPL